MKFDLSNLNDFEFEILCKDIAQRKLGIELRVFKQGADGGIDAADVGLINSVVIQAKRYIKTSFNKLMTVLKKEKKKVDKIKPQNYYVFTSLELSKKEIEKIFILFNGYMRDSSFIWSGLEINEFLQINENKDILNKNYKLWLGSSTILENLYNYDICIDGESLIDDIKKKSSLYVQTDFFGEAIKCLEKERAVVIIGNPGVGKTTISSIIALYYLNKGYKIRFSSGNDIVNLKRIISNPAEKELIYLDDFIGQHYLELKYEKVNAISHFVSYIKNMPNKMILMNSRITIFKEGQSKHEVLNNNKFNPLIIDISVMPLKDRACILYNHLYFCNVDKIRCNQIVKDKNYYNILKHENYSPRIIEFITRKNNYETHSAKDYYKFIIKTLDNPEYIWEDEFINRMDTVDRIFLYTLYSISDNEVEYEVLKKAFEKRLCFEPNIDSTKNQLNLVLKRLSKSVVKIIGAKKPYIEVISPSVNDYLKKTLLCNKTEINRILNSAAYINQYVRLVYNFCESEELNQLIISKRLFGLDFYRDESPEFYFFRYLIETKNVEYRDLILPSLNKLHSVNPYDISNLLGNFFTRELICNFTLLNDLIVPQIIEELFGFLLWPDVLKITQTLHQLLIGNEKMDIILKHIKTYIINAIGFEIQMNFKHEFYDIYWTGIRELDKSKFEMLKEKTEREIQKFVIDSIECYLSEFPTEIEIKKDDFNIYDIYSYIDLSYEKQQSVGKHLDFSKNEEIEDIMSDELTEEKFIDDLFNKFYNNF